jgi:hypothetical protein
METLYQKSRIISSVKKYFSPYIALLTKPSGHKLILLLLGILGMQVVASIAHIYKWFLSPLGKISANAYYYLLSYTRLPLEKFAETTLRKAISLIEPKLTKLPVLLLLDDTLQAKFGTKFECCATMFDHAKHNGSSYLKGHCFVALTICVPVTVGGHIQYLNVPIRFRVRGTDESKLVIASEMINDAMKILKDTPMVILLCDSWYPKGEVIETVLAHGNLELIANVRVDTAMFELPQRTGKRGRPEKKGKPVSIRNDFIFEKIEKYFIATKTVLTNLFGDTPVYMTATAPNFVNDKAYRLFISTVFPEQLEALFIGYEQILGKNEASSKSWLFPLRLYSFRWCIEVMFYELKTFWSFGAYRLRSKIGIDNFVNILSIAYVSSKIIPLAEPNFQHLRNASPQAAKFAIGNAIHKDLFFAHFLDFLETHLISADLFHDLDFSDFFAKSS